MTGKPLDYKGTQARAVHGRRLLRERRHAQPARRRACSPTSGSTTRFGVSLSGAYSERDSEVDRYKRQAGQSDYAYRGSTFAGTL